MKQINVLVVDDSAFMRKMITEILQSDSSISVVATARNGLDGVEKALELKPDVITLDIEMPKMNGIEALQTIMNKLPTPIVMLSSMTQEGADSTINALNLGAVDFIMKPSGPISLDINKIRENIIHKVKSAARVNMGTIAKEVHSLTVQEPKRIESTFEHNNLDAHPSGTYSTRKKIVAIGVSTGGPRALQKLLTKLPKNYPAPIVIVQHMPAGFTKSLADRLNKLCSITVKEAEHGEFLQSGTAYIAPGNYHLTVKKLGTSITAFIDQTDPKGGHRPSVDKLFQSLANLSNYQKTLVILTGMGSDGTNGIRKVKLQDPKTKVLAESEESAIVFGMPKAAIHSTNVDYVVHIEEMGKALCEFYSES